MRKLPILLLPLVLIGCRASVDVRPEEAPAAPPPPPAAEETVFAEVPFLMNDADALDAGRDFCRKRRYHCVLKDAQYTEKRRWRVRYEATRGEASGPLQLEFDAVTWALRDVDDRVRGPGYASAYDEEPPSAESERAVQPQKRGKRQSKVRRKSRQVQ